MIEVSHGILEYFAVPLLHQTQRVPFQRNIWVPVSKSHILNTERVSLNDLPVYILLAICRLSVDIQGLDPRMYELPSILGGVPKFWTCESIHRDCV